MVVNGLQARISAALSRSAPQVGRTGAATVGSRGGCPVPEPRRSAGLRVRAYEVRETVGGVCRRSVLLVPVGGRR